MITQERFKMLLFALMHLNDLQLNYANEVKKYLKERDFYNFSNKSHIEAILKNLRNNAASKFSNQIPKEHYADLGNMQDKMEEIIEQTFSMLFDLDKKFMLFTFTDYYIGDRVWINYKDKPMEVEVMSGRVNADFVCDPEPHTVTQFFIEVQAINKAGHRYGKKFWVKDEHIAKHKKEIIQNEESQ